MFGLHFVPGLCLERYLQCSCSAPCCSTTHMTLNAPAGLNWQWQQWRTQVRWTYSRPQLNGAVSCQALCDCYCYLLKHLQQGTAADTVYRTTQHLGWVCVSCQPYLCVVHCVHHTVHICSCTLLLLIVCAAGMGLTEDSHAAVHCNASLASSAGAPTQRHSSRGEGLVL
jgi:hypothetical protein